MSRALQTGADARALRDTKFPEIFKQKVDITKVQLPVIKKWMADKITKLQGFDDDFLPIMIEEMLIEHRDIREIQTSIRDSLGPPTAAFCLELWKLCLSAQQDPNGVPKELLEAKKLEVKQQKVR
ncbi:PWI domain-containing protein [Dissoconium aciculare CBS 342.82]|uniref:PWI domain-containing protein n=1 Tax=Dissoconium aciculare CBS 342.82 TaxID=1314786 RepID=A0A6J3LUL9_9PEZI|nr:PWI domain-containing protein [Dissoconium aciculare CBS 342.82]KAF1819353.1 PWI domain-containing protein [Dissoconium aciculare CBS 342.82]